MGAIDPPCQQSTAISRFPFYAYLDGHGKNCGRRILSAPVGRIESGHLRSSRLSLNALQGAQKRGLVKVAHWNVHNYCLACLSEGYSGETAGSLRQTQLSVFGTLRVVRRVVTCRRWHSQMPPVDSATAVARSQAVSKGTVIFPSQVWFTCRRYPISES